MKRDMMTEIQVRRLLDLKADRTSTYSKSETDAKLQEKRNVADSLAKADIETRFFAKADRNAVYTKKESYTSDQVDRFLAKKSDRADFDEFTANFAATKADREEVYSRE